MDSSIWISLTFIVCFIGSVPTGTGAKLIIGNSWNNTIAVDCHPEKNADEASCTARGCIWTESDVPNAPFCTFPSGYGYEMIGTPVSTDWGYSIHLRRKQGQPSIYGNDVDDLYLSIEFWEMCILRLKFYDPNNARYEVPVPLNTPTKPAVLVIYDVYLTLEPQFGVAVKRAKKPETIFDTRAPGFVFSDQFLEITTRLNSPFVYGLGEQRHMSYAHDVNWRTWAMFARDKPPDSDANLYGSQPFYMNIEDDGSANGAFLLNSNAMEVTLQPEPALTYRTIGGILDFYIFLGPTPEAVVQQYTSLIGRPLMPPYWSLGFQLCKYGYVNTSEVRDIVERMREAKIPQDVQWTDIDYMDQFKDFTLSKTAFADLPDLIDDIHEHDQKFIVIIDAGIGEFPDDFPYQEGIKEDIFIKYQNGTLLHAYVWPGPAVFPDFSHENVQRYWSNMYRHLYEDLNVQYDGIWTDMNEPSNFHDGSETGCEVNNLNYPPYAPHILGAEKDGKLFEKTICMDPVQRAGRHYDVHNLFGYLESEKTFNALKDLFPTRRPVVVSRSTFPGSARYASHWLGDNASTWQAIKDGIIGILEYNLFGTPFVGADICGFLGSTTEELCTRWMQVGAFYPFSRNHNGLGSLPQDPPSLGPRVVAASIKSLTQRYRLLPYLYSLLQNSHDHGSTVARSMLHQYSSDSNTWNISTQFMWGSGLMISPVLDEGVVTVDVYFPLARWFDYYTGAEITTTGQSVTFDAPLDGNIVLHVVGGNIIPTQEPGLTTAESRTNSLGLLVALDISYQATGTLYWDDGETPETRSSGFYNEFQFIVSENLLDIIVLNNGLDDMISALDDIIIYGLESAPISVTVDGSTLDPSQVSYDATTNALELKQLKLKMPRNHQISVNTN